MSFLVSFALSMSLITQAAPGPESLLRPVSQNITQGQTVVFEPVGGHHFNLKSPHRCGLGENHLVTEPRIECLMTVSGAQTVELFVCDDPNTFCKRELIEVHVSGGSKLKDTLNEWFFKFQNLFGSKKN